jgi:hypothetical protein
MEMILLKEPTAQRILFKGFWTTGETHTLSLWVEVGGI